MQEKKIDAMTELNEVEIIELEDAWLDDAAGGANPSPTNGTCPTLNYMCKPPPV